MVRSEVLDRFFADLRDERFTVSFAVYHRRFSTNTLPRWPLAQPMRLLGHNGEINTLLGNINWASAAEANLEAVWGDAASDLRPLVNADFSDSANLDATLELMVRSGRPITDSLLTLVPEAFRDQPELDDRPAIKDFYDYNACLQEPWDGPALLVFSDGRMVGATLDRNGLRPARYCLTSDGYVVMGSETGVVELEESRIIEKGRLGPGQMLAVDLEQGRVLHNWEVKEESASRHPYGRWLAEQSRSTHSRCALRSGACIGGCRASCCQGGSAGPLSRPLRVAALTATSWFASVASVAAGRRSRAFTLLVPGLAAVFLAAQLYRLRSGMEQRS
jgi:glutamate synthase (ferredoxin)